MDIVGILTGAVGVGVVYFIYLAATKGLPAAWAWLKAWWTAGAAELNAVKARIAALEADVAKLKTPAAPAA
jgi:hypothetical protein